MNLLKQSGWLRALEIITGLLTIIFGILVFAFPEWGITTLIVLVAVGLFFIGLRSIAVIGVKELPWGIRGLSAIAGIISVVLAMLAVAYPSFGVVTLLTFVSIGLAIQGFTRIFLAYALKDTVSSVRGLMVAVGVADVILSIVILFLPGLALLVFATVLAVILLLSGAEMVVSGVIGRTWLGDLVEAAIEETQ